LLRRIVADDEEVRRGLQAAKACTGRKHYNISGCDRKFMPAGATEDDTCIAICNAENFVCSGVIVMKVVNSVPPLRRPRRASERLSILDSDRHIIPPIIVGSTELASRTSTLFPRGSHSNLLSVPL
jgi:hypothetical protein